jgi:hypothetical protein
LLTINTATESVDAGPVSRRRRLLQWRANSQLHGG